MKIAYMCPFNDTQCGESEARTRITYCLEKSGHKVIEINNANRLFRDSTIHIDSIGADFVFSHGVAEQIPNVYPNIFSGFFYWCPPNFLTVAQGIDYISYINKHDAVVGGYESYKTFEDLKNGEFFDYDKLLKFCASVPADWVVPPKKSSNKKVFYVGMNIESKYKKMRYSDLISYLNENDLIDIYGPNTALGLKNLWSDFKNYKGDIPFDGKTILSKINEAGICLAFNSDVHSSINYVSNRIYEAAASGSIIISDENEYVRKYFKDSVYYVNVQQDEEKVIEDIKKILDDIASDPDKAYNMACEAQRIFVEELSLEKQVENLIEYLKQEQEKAKDIEYQKEIIDVICYVDKVEDYQKIQKELQSQYYQNLHLLVISVSEVYEQIKNSITYTHTFVEKQKYRGQSLKGAKGKLRGKFFILLDGYSAMHKNHLNKHLFLLSKKDALYAYSGTYVKRVEDGKSLDYETLNFRPIEKESFLSLLVNLDANIDSKLEFENNFAMSSVIFKKEILDLSEDIELSQISTSPHLYLIMCSIIKAKNEGCFSYTISSGYELKMEQKIDEIFDFSRKFYNKYGKAGNLTVYELASVFFKYDNIVKVKTKCANNYEVNAVSAFDQNLIKFIYQCYKPFYIIDKTILKFRLLITFKKEKKERLKDKLRALKEGYSNLKLFR